MKIKYWTSTPNTDPTKPTKTKGKKTTSTANSPFCEVEVDVATLGFTPESWTDLKNEDNVEKVMRNLPGIRMDWGVSIIRQ